MIARTHTIQQAHVAAGARPYASCACGHAWAEMPAASVVGLANAKRFAATTTKRPARHLGRRTT
jgi:hypothetical protein